MQLVHHKHQRINHPGSTLIKVKVMMIDGDGDEDEDYDDDDNDDDDDPARGLHTWHRQ